MLRQKLYNLLLPLINRDIVKKNILLKWLRRGFGLIFIPKKTRVFNHIMYLHKSGHSFELAFENCYESLETFFLKSLDLYGKVAIDVGSCIGYYTLILSESVGNKGKILAFEPDITNFQLLQKNIVINNANNVLNFQLAVGDKNQKAYLKHGESPGQHSITDIYNGNNQVNIINLDEFLESKNIFFEDVQYVKIDVEGYEFKVLKGMNNIIEKSKKLIIQFEFAPQHLAEQNCNLKELILFIKKHKLKTYYWDFKINKLIECNDQNWFIEENTIENFKKGALYSRNIILSKVKINSKYVIKELQLDGNGVVKKLDSIFIKPPAYLDFKISENTKIELPRSGNYFVEILKNIKLSNKTVLDIGTGYFGFLARHAKLFGARKVVAVDLNSDAIKYASSSIEEDVEFRVSDVYSSIKSNEKFDVIISNPPQLPSIFGGKIHDVAGEDGMAVINKIINNFKFYTKKNGELYILLFDFLLDKTIKICKRNKFDVDVIAYYNKHLRNGGETEKRKDVIENIFPNYKFKSDNNGFYHRIYILKISI